MVLMLGLFGLFYGALFRLTRNIFVLWPFTWAGASAMGTVSGGFVFGWYHVKLYSVVLVVQLLCIWAFYRSGRHGVDNDSNNIDTGKVKTTNNMGFQDLMRACVYVPLMLYQFYLSWRFYNSLGLGWVTDLGWLVLTVSAVFGWLPIFEFRRRGDVPEDKSYIHTTRLVTSGVYSVVRHPQFLAGILITVSMMLMSQHPHSVVAGLVAAVVYASEVPSADRRLAEKFGEPYQRYKERVPALNFFAGMARLIRRDGPLKN
jgi:protein-S-isoprenylcysteine O-methyltransferase Ste14